MGLSKYNTRDELVTQYATGLTEEVNAATQRMFDTGHEAEALARPMAEEIRPPNPITVMATREWRARACWPASTASTLLEEKRWENKLLNQSLEKQVQPTATLEPPYYLQMEHQLHGQRANRAPCSPPATRNARGQEPTVVQPKPERRAQLILAGGSSS